MLGLACRGDAVFPSDDVEKIIWAEAFFSLSKVEQVAFEVDLS